MKNEGNDVILTSVREAINEHISVYYDTPIYEQIEEFVNMNIKWDVLKEGIKDIIKEDTLPDTFSEFQLLLANILNDSIRPAVYTITEFAPFDSTNYYKKSSKSRINYDKKFKKDYTKFKKDYDKIDDDGKLKVAGATLGVLGAMIIVAGAATVVGAIGGLVGGTAAGIVLTSTLKSELKKVRSKKQKTESKKKK